MKKLTINGVVQAACFDNAYDHKNVLRGSTPVAVADGEPRSVPEEIWTWIGYNGDEQIGPEAYKATLK